MKENLKTKKSLEDQERLFYALTASEEGIWDWDRESDTGYLSPRYYEMLGYRHGEFSGTGKTWLNMIHPDDREQALKSAEKVFMGKEKSYQSTYRMQAKDSSYKWILSRALAVRWDKNGSAIRLVGTHMDITETREKDEQLLRHKEILEKEVERQTQELKAANRQLKTVLDASSEGIWVFDGTRKVIAINKAAEKLSNLTRKAVVGRHIKDLKKTGLFDQLISEEVFDTGKKVSRIQELQQINRQLLVTGIPVLNDNHEIEMVVLNERNLTHLNKLKDQLQEMRQTNIRYQEELTSINLQELRDQDIIAESKEMQQVIVTAIKLARHKATPILLMGESGTGKGLMAKFIHNQGFGLEKPFVQINCAALPETLLEAELFGYEKGAFTGAADKGKIGLFEMAKGGTIFLDELGEMSLSIQAKLLKCFEEKAIRHLGGLKPIKIDCNIIAATNKNLLKQVGRKKFRKDFFFRLNTFTITIPPLRDRLEDILEMTLFFLKKYNAQYGVQRHLSAAFKKKVQSHSFPGNIRELKNLLKKAIILGEADATEDIDNAPFQDTITVDSIGKKVDFSTNLHQEKFDFHEKMLACEKELFSKALENHRTTRSLAKFLELSQASIVRKLKIHGLTKRLKRSAPKRQS